MKIKDTEQKVLIEPKERGYVVTVRVEQPKKNNNDGDSNMFYALTGQNLNPTHREVQYVFEDLTQMLIFVGSLLTSEQLSPSELIET